MADLYKYGCSTAYGFVSHGSVFHFGWILERCCIESILFPILTEAFRGLLHMDVPISNFT